ncbi:MAG: hypothetical protein NVSMB31_01760 [Vulcanimicrobiaceae bacterium]
MGVSSWASAVGAAVFTGIAAALCEQIENANNRGHVALNGLPNPPPMPYGFPGGAFAWATKSGGPPVGYWVPPSWTAVPTPPPMPPLQ